MFKAIAATVLVCMVAVYGVAGLVDIDPGEVGIVVKKIGPNKGMQDIVLYAGLDWYDPFRYDVIIYNVRAYQADEVKSMSSNTKDGQPVEVDISLEIKLVESTVPDLHLNIGPDYYDQVIYPRLRSSVRNRIPSELSDVVYTDEGRLKIQGLIQQDLSALKERGIGVYVNLRDLRFLNKQFIATLEAKAQAAQDVQIQERKALASIHTAERIANLAEGEKQKRIKAAEARREELRLEGEGERLKQEERAKGILAVRSAEAEGTRLKREALSGPGGPELVSMEWAKYMGPNVKVMGVPTGAPGTTSLIDFNGLLSTVGTIGAGGKK